MFAKLFELEKHGQVLVTKDNSDEDAPQIKITFEIEGAIIKYAPTYENSDAGLEKRNFCFENITEQQVIANVEVLKNKLAANV